jgi:sec-independent protein translocase protein TatB
VFNLQGSELVIILLLALVVLGPEKLPDAMRKAGQFYAELKKMSSSFQQEFRSVIDEPVREVRNTANLLRDSADFRKLQTGEREEKPKSAEMVAPAEPDAVPASEVPTFEPRDAAAQDPTATPSPPRPFSAGQQSSAAPRPRPDADVPPSDVRDEADGDTADEEGTPDDESTPHEESAADERTPDEESAADERTPDERTPDEVAPADAAAEETVQEAAVGEERAE